MLSCKGKAESVGRLLKTIKINDIMYVVKRLVEIKFNKAAVSSTISQYDF